MVNDAPYKTWDDNVGYAWPSELAKANTDQGADATAKEKSTTPASTPPNAQQVTSGRLTTGNGTVLTHTQLYEKNKENRRPGSEEGQNDGRNGGSDDKRQLAGETKGGGNMPHPPVVD